MIKLDYTIVLEEMCKMFETDLASYEHEPRRFIYQYMLAEYWLNRNNSGGGYIEGINR